ncbi:MAG: FAD-binding oxidoreductase [bacterium]
MSNILHQLRAALAPTCILTGEDVSSRSAGSWGSPGNVKAKAIVRPRTTEEVAAIMRLCHRAGQTVVLHGGLTNVVSSALSTDGDLVLSLELMDRIEEIDAVSRTMTVQAGAVLQNIQEAAKTAGLMFPLDLGARGSCQIGGNVATNAGGTHVIRYGVTRDLVLGLEAVLADGTILSSMNKMIKNNAGYDLKQLFIGSEGTLGVITRVVLKLCERPKSQNTAFVAMDSFEHVTALLKFLDSALGGTLSAFEVLWRDYYELVTDDSTPHQAPIPCDYSHFALVEALGGNEEQDAEFFAAALAEAADQGLLAESVVATTQTQRDAIWAMRDDVHRVFKYAPLYMFDVSLPIKHMDIYVDEVKRGLNSAYSQNICFVFGHLGDGNLHIIISAGEDTAENRTTVEKSVYEPLRKVAGSISAEHGIGLEKKAYLSWCRSETEISLMKTLKQTLDPKGILNPGKVFDP